MNEINDMEKRDAEGGAPATLSLPKRGGNYVLAASILLSAVILSGAWMYVSRQSSEGGRGPAAISQSDKIRMEEAMAPEKGYELPAVWGDLGARLSSLGVIDPKALEGVHSRTGDFTDEYKKLLYGNSEGRLKITRDNSAYLLNLLWAFGLANQNPILEKGEMTDKRYGGAQNFASTAGWTLAKGGAMSHYSKHKLVELTEEQQALVDRMSRGIFRPCCGNSTHFPDCNHGMAMLGLLELMASQGAGEKEMWDAALKMNAYWFPETYLTIAAYKESKGTKWKDVDPKEVLGADYSSAGGYARLRSEFGSQGGTGAGGGCGVAPVSLPKGGSGCGVR